MHLRLLRHATLVLQLNDVTLLVDPMLSPAAAMDPVMGASNTLRIPLVDLPLNEAELTDLLQHVDAVLVTHNHRDHWDAKAIELLRKDLPIFCQPVDETAIRQRGFTSVYPIETETTWRSIQFNRTGGHHGTGEVGERMGNVSGFVLRSDSNPTLYIAGDTIWCQEVHEALDRYHPSITVVNSGSAQFLEGGPITMNAEDVVTVCHEAPDTQVIAVHMEAVNHCLLTRDSLREKITNAGLLDRVLIPADGQDYKLESTTSLLI